MVDAFLILWWSSVKGTSQKHGQQQKKLGSSESPKKIEDSQWFCMFHHVGLVAQVLRFMKSFSLSAIPSSRLASSIANVGVENCGINQRGTSQNVPHSPGHANPLFAHFHSWQRLLNFMSYLFVTRMTLMFRFWLGDSHMLQSVWQRKLQWRRHWCYERLKSECW